jgi:hypothetical protein
MGNERAMAFGERNMDRWWVDEEGSPARRKEKARWVRG